MKKFVGLNADFIGSVAALACMLHCMILPLLFAFGLVGMSTCNHTIDLLFFGFGVVIAFFTLIKDFVFLHGKYIPMGLVSIGFVLLYIGISFHSNLIILSIFGGICICMAHYLNWRLKRDI